MSRIGDAVRGLFAGSDNFVPPADLGQYDIGKSTPLPGPHIDPPLDQADTDRYRPYGATGTINYKGYLQPSDYNPDLQRFAALDVYERMRRSDPSIRETLWTVKQPIVNAEWTVEPPDDATDEEREQAEFVRAALFEWMEQPWTEFLEHVLTYLDFGHSVCEPVFQVVTRELTVRSPTTSEEQSSGGKGAATPAKSAATMKPPTSDSDPGMEDADDGDGGAAADDEEGTHVGSELPTATKDVVQVPIPLPPDTETQVLPPRQFTTWRRFSPRLPRTIWKWNHDEYGELTSITQTVWLNMPDGTQGYRVVEIPAQNLMVFTHEKWGDEWTGISLLRSSYKAWIMKELIERVAGIAYERHGVGYLVAYLPQMHADDPELQKQIGVMLSQLRQDAWAVMPGPKQQAGSTAVNQGYLVELLTPPGGIPQFEPILTYWRGEIAGSMLARFKELGHAATGARATADVQAAVWYNALHAIARYIESQMNTTIRRLVDMNYADVRRYPTLKAAGIEARNLLEFAQAVALLTDAKMLSTDTPTRSWVRAEVDAPPEDLAETRAIAQFEQMQAQAAQDAAQAQAEAKQNGKLSPTDQAKASSKVRGGESEAGANSARPRKENT